MAIFGLTLGKGKKPKLANLDNMQDADAPPMTGTHDAPHYSPPYAESYAPEPAYRDDPRMGDLTVGEYATGVPNIRLSELFKSFGRQLKWVLPLFALGTIAAWYFTKDFKRVYSGDGRIMVQLGEEYVYNPITGSANGGGLTQTPDTITLNEVAIIKNAEVMDQVIGEMMPDDAAMRRFNEDAFKKIINAPNERARQEAYMELRKFVDRNFVVMAQPKASIIDMVFKHEDPDVAVETLNAFIDAYLSYRRTIFVEGSGDIISERRIATEQQLDQNERAIARFLQKNSISDFESEQSGLRKRTEDLKALLNTTRASIAETEASLAEVEDQLRNTPSTINLYVDDRASQRIAQAELELKQLLAKYLPTSDPVRQKQTELAELKSLQSSYNGQANGGRRVGPNPVQQALLTQRNTLAATADSLREKEFTLQNQLNSADRKIQRLTGLTPAFQNLLRERDTLSARLKNYNAKEQEALINQSQAEANSENIKVISRATYPNKGRNMSLLMFALATVGWGVTLFVLALMRVFLDPRLYVSPGPNVRTRRPVPVEDYGYGGGSSIPEPVAPYRPATPMPQYQPDTMPQVAEAEYPQETYAPDPNYAPQEEYGSSIAQQTAQRMSSSAAAAGLSEWTPPQQPVAPQTATSTAQDIYANPYAQAVSETYTEQNAPVFAPPPNS
ncbi:hypothetical protein ACJ3XI_07110 [Litorimonas sp. RW-G-Af-16]|uniref:GumC family protein n=1 Tax=Litorimonas sp. RW-G-Af-16 TaxID=3241168 RepID=UPI00390CB20D